ncbi:M23 family metallopeptidase [Corynebacterium sp.]|jgi:murein DD-endopeptidase MepM/ murein hydrolase activator NlpD|uniref:M23 family metallopeptidase n=1 Tax=Corynebacterium sp. TaxID=1720 RepID=UPI0025BC8EB2|nr:M23 family metallopeptidase [Corynebacterium sp.]
MTTKTVDTVPRLAAALLSTALSVGLTTVPTAAAPESPPGSPPGANHLRPAPGAVLVPADIPEQNWLPGHRGVDLDASPGLPVRASAAGTVRFAGVVAGTPTVSVDHGNGLRTTYEPVLAQVRAGEQLGRGDVLGVLAGNSSLPETARRDPGLHWGAVLGPPAEDAEHYIDPMTLLGPVQVRLWR